MKKYILFLVTVALLSSCFDLDHEEFGSISSTNFPSSSADLEAAAIGVYKNLGESYIARSLDYAGLTLNELCTDEMNTAWTSSWQIINTLAWTANNDPAKKYI